MFIDGRPGRWLISLVNRQIVKSTANADWQQKAGSWSAQGVADGRGVEFARGVARLVDFQSDNDLRPATYIIG